MNFALRDLAGAKMARFDSYLTATLNRDVHVVCCRIVIVSDARERE